MHPKVNYTQKERNNHIVLCVAPPKASLLYFNHNVNDDNFRNFEEEYDEDEESFHFLNPLLFLDLLPKI